MRVSASERAHTCVCVHTCVRVCMCVCVCVRVRAFSQFIFTFDGIVAVVFKCVHSSVFCLFLFFFCFLIVVILPYVFHISLVFCYALFSVLFSGDVQFKIDDMKAHRKRNAPEEGKRYIIARWTF